MVREEGFGSLARGVTPNVFRSILMNSSQLASWVLLYSSFLVFLFGTFVDHRVHVGMISLKPSYWRHVTSRTTLYVTLLPVLLQYVLLVYGSNPVSNNLQGTVATTVCSPADVLKVGLWTHRRVQFTLFMKACSQSRIMNASGPGSNVRLFNFFNINMKKNKTSTNLNFS